MSKYPPNPIQRIPKNDSITTSSYCLIEALGVLTDTQQNNNWNWFNETNIDWIANNQLITTTINPQLAHLHFRSILSSKKVQVVTKTTNIRETIIITHEFIIQKSSTKMIKLKNAICYF